MKLQMTLSNAWLFPMAYTKLHLSTTIHHPLNKKSRTESSYNWGALLWSVIAVPTSQWDEMKFEGAYLFILIL